MHNHNHNHNQLLIFSALLQLYTMTHYTVQFNSTITMLELQYSSRY